MKKLRNLDNKIASVIQDEQVNKIVAADETLLTFYPKIKGVPEEKRKQAQKQQTMEQNNQNASRMLTQERLKKFEFEKEREEYNKELERLVVAEKKKQEDDKKEAKRKELEATKIIDE